MLAVKFSVSTSPRRKKKNHPKIVALASLINLWLETPELNSRALGQIGWKEATSSFVMCDSS